MRKHIDPTNIKNQRAQRNLELFLNYKHLIDERISEMPKPIREKISDSIKQVDEWSLLVYRLVGGIDTIEENKIISRDKTRIPQELVELRKLALAETNAGKKEEIKAAIAAREQLLENLKQFDLSLQEMHKRLDTMVAQIKHLFEFVKNLELSTKK